MHSPLLLLLFLTSPITTTAQSFPKINLDYATHTPTSINTTASGTKVALYNNIRFAQPPTGALRFRKPRTPPELQNGTQDGRDRLSTSDCVSTVHPLAPYPGINGTSWGQEDCLFLNVWVPEGVLPGDKVPVLHWLHGSAWAFGSKDLFGDAFGLMETIEDRGDRFIYVASNYRMGVYGWVSSANESMDANVGLHDGVAALQWTKKYIERFGGDPDNISAMGQSAGAAMIAMMLVANDGNGTLPFHKAFLSSPGIMPRRNVTERRQEVYDAVLRTANCSSLGCLRNASPSSLAATNKKVMELPGGSGGGALGPSIGVGPFPDGKYISDAVPVLLQQGRYNKKVKAVMSGNMAAEGLGTSADVSTLEDFGALVRRLVPGVSNFTIKNIRAMYPYPDSQFQRVADDWTTDVVFACNARAVAKAYGNRAQRYVFSVPPATHGLDSSYYFYRDNTEIAVQNVSLAREFQSELLEFARDDIRDIDGPNEEDNDNEADDDNNTDGNNSTDDWPLYVPGSNMVNITLSGFKRSVDPWDKKPNCDIIMRTIWNDSNGA
ncbi:hypothetical protein BBP40_010651 [Aspergillus hancockii]|nr:hypothetical protein BBP40_010651 [Aspergillus hancockii]